MSQAPLQPDVETGIDPGQAPAASFLARAGGNIRDFLREFGPALVVLVFFYGFLARFGPGRLEAPVVTWTGAWNKESDFEHGWIFPFMLVGLLYWRRKDIAAARGEGEWLGILPVAAGAILYVLAYRTLQWRVAIIGLPFILTGSVWYLWGRRAAWLLAFPFFLIWLAIPVGFLQQMTGGLQLISSKLAHLGSAVFGVKTELQGNTITLGGSSYNVDEGCSGVRSLWALMLIAAAWTYATRMRIWKKAVFFASAFPIAVLGNAMRLISIFVIAKYSSEDFARKTWHDWSPLIFFYPFSLFLLLSFHSLLEGGLPWKKGRPRKQVRRVVVTHAGSPNPGSSAP